MLSALEILNSPTQKLPQSEENKKLNESIARKKNIESYYSKKNLEKYLSTTNSENEEHLHNKKYMQNKFEKIPENFAENRSHFFRINYNLKNDDRVENAMCNDHQKKILETR